jgi:hypothetical protein
VAHRLVMRTLAWALGMTGALACAAAGGATLSLGLSDQVLPLASGYLFGILMGVLGALICVREPRNSIGWLMGLTSVWTSQINLPSDYAYAALVTNHGAWPFGSVALWFSTWASIPVFGLFLPLILARFPDGRVRPRWRFAEWLAVAGTVIFIVSVALAPADTPLFVSAAATALLVPHARNPLGISLADSTLAYLWMSGLGTILLAYAASAGSLVARFRRASREQSMQLKWFAYAGVLIAIMAVYAGFAWYRGQSLGDALVPFAVGVVALPGAIGIAVLRYRLYDIDLIINRTLVYGGTTAILAAAYSASITLFQRLFISASGQKSDAAYVLTAFVIVVGFSPLKDWLQRKVDRRMGRNKSREALDAFRSQVDSVVSVLNIERVACRLLDEVVSAYDVRGGALYLESGLISRPTYSVGHLNGDAAIEVQLHGDGRLFGRLVLGSRRGDAAYSKHDCESLQRSADSVSEALALAAHLGLRPSTASQK